MLNELIKLADRLDRKGLKEEADCLDEIVKSAIELFDPATVLDVAGGWQYMVDFLAPNQFTNFKNKLNEKMGPNQDTNIPWWDHPVRPGAARQLAELESVLKAMHDRGQPQAIFDRLGGGDDGVAGIVDAIIGQLQYM